MVPTLIKQIHSFSDGSIQIQQIEPQQQLYQIGDDIKFFGKRRDCSSGGCPSVAVLYDQADTVFTKDLQYYLIAINLGENPGEPNMKLNNISNTMGTAALLMNKTGAGAPDRRDWILEENLTAPKDCQLDKLRSMCLNTHKGWDDGVYAYLETMDGNSPPQMAINPSTGLPYPRPQSISEIVPHHYLMLPSNPIYRPLFLDLTNVKWKPDTQSLDYGPFDNGITRSWIGDKRPHTFFPFISKRGPVKIPLSKLNKITLGSSFPSPFRNG